MHAIDITPANAGTNRNNAHCPLRQTHPFFPWTLIFSYRPDIYLVQSEGF